MDILQQCRIWHKDNKYQEIIDALEAIPAGERTPEMNSELAHALSFPLFGESFRERTMAAWKAFAEHEAELRRFMDEDRKHDRGDEMVAKCNEILSIAFHDVAFEMGFNGGKYELILTPEGDKVKLFELVYFQSHAPETVLKHWSILVGRCAMDNFGLRFGDWSISAEDVQVWIEQPKENRIALSAYCEKLSAVSEEDVNKVWWMLTTLTDQVLGEIPHMKYIDSFYVLDAPKEEPYSLLSELPEKLKAMGMDLTIDAEAYLENDYLGFRCEPDENPEADWRMDIIAGSTNCLPIINDYLNGENYYMDALRVDGVMAGFLCYPLNIFTGENRSQQVFDFRDKLEAALIGADGEGKDAVTLIGGATGIYYGYVDFIAWDMRAVFNTAKQFFEDSDLPRAGYHVFRRGLEAIPIKEETSESLACKPENVCNTPFGN